MRILGQGTRKSLIAASIIGWSLVVAPVAVAHDDPFDHGPDSTSIDAGPEMPAPTGGAKGASFRLGGAPTASAAAASVRAALPSAWCGDPAATTDNTADQVDNGAYRYHAIYAIPAD